MIILPHYTYTYGFRSCDRTNTSIGKRDWTLHYNRVGELRNLRHSSFTSLHKLRLRTHLVLHKNCPHITPLITFYFQRRLFPKICPLPLRINFLPKSALQQSLRNCRKLFSGSLQAVSSSRHVSTLLPNFPARCSFSSSVTAIFQMATGAWF